MKNRLLSVLFVLFAIYSQGIYAQWVSNACPGVTITASQSSGMAGQPDCAGISAVLLPGGWTGTSGAGFVRYNWLSPISSVRIEFFSVNTNDYGTISTNSGGALSITSANGCAPVSGVVVGPYTGGGAYGTTAFQVTSTIPFTQLNFINTGASSGWVCDCPVNVILAVEMDFFQANYLENHGNVKLDWQTSTESNSSHFVVERSADGTEWQSVGTVKAAGNSISSVSYAFEDALPISGKSMYRLQQVDLDGSFRLSGVETVFVDDYLKAYPTIADQVVHVTSLANAASVTIYDHLGKQHECPAIAEPNGFAFDVSQLENGFYFLRIADAGAVVSRKIWVRR